MRLWDRQRFPFTLPERTHPRLTGRGRRVRMAALILLSVGCVMSSMPIIHLAVCALALLAVSAVVAMLNVRRLQYKRRAPDSARAGEPFEVEVEVFNSRRFWPAFSLRLTDDLLEGECRHNLEFDRVSPGATTKTITWARLPRRGRYGEFGARLESSFPFGLATCEAAFAPADEIVVQPRPARTGALFRMPAAVAGEGFAWRGMACDTMGEFRTLRDFAPGDSPRLVCWPVSARHGGLVVREFECPAPRHVHVVFHSCSVPMVLLSPRSFERSLEALAGLFVELHERLIGFSFTADFLAWRTVSVLPEACALDAALGLLADAGMSVDSPPAAAYAAVGSAPEEAETIVALSNTPLRYWAAGLPFVHAHVMCFDNGKLLVNPELGAVEEGVPA